MIRRNTPYILLLGAAAVLEFDCAVRYGEEVLFGAGEVKKP
jgi:hypothetical protein